MLLSLTLLSSLLISSPVTLVLATPVSKVERRAEPNSLKSWQIGNCYPAGIVWPASYNTPLGTIATAADCSAACSGSTSTAFNNLFSIWVNAGATVRCLCSNSDPGLPAVNQLSKIGACDSTYSQSYSILSSFQRVEASGTSSTTKAKCATNPSFLNTISTTSQTSVYNCLAACSSTQADSLSFQLTTSGSGNCQCGNFIGLSPNTGVDCDASTGGDYVLFAGRFGAATASQLSKKKKRSNKLSRTIDARNVKVVRDGIALPHLQVANARN